MIIKKEFVIGENTYILEYATYKDRFWEKTEFPKYSLRIRLESGQLKVMSWYKPGEGFHVFLSDIETQPPHSLQETTPTTPTPPLTHATLPDNPRRSF